MSLLLWSPQKGEEGRNVGVVATRDSCAAEGLTVGLMWLNSLVHVKDLASNMIVVVTSIDMIIIIKRGI